MIFMKQRFFFSIAILFALIMPLGATDNFLNLASQDLFLQQGYPDDLMPMRGESEAEDCIVVNYNDGMSFILWENRVKEIRADKRYRGSIFGLYMGMTPTDARTALGIDPKEEMSGELIFHKLDTMLPVKIHLFFHADKLVNIAISLLKN